MLAIGIDLGTTSICGILIDTDSGKVLRSRTENSDAFIESEHSWERMQQPERIINLAMAILEDLLCDNVASIGVTGQMHGIVYVDHNGKAVSPLYTWQDGRGNQPYLDTTYAQYLHSHSGLVGSGNGLRKNPALQKRVQEVFGTSLRIPMHTEEAAYGAALFALVASGYCKSAADAQKLIQFETE